MFEVFSHGQTRHTLPTPLIPASHIAAQSAVIRVQGLPVRGCQSVPGRERVHVVSPVRNLPVFHGGLSGSMQHLRAAYTLERLHGLSRGLERFDNLAPV